MLYAISIVTLLVLQSEETFSAKILVVSAMCTGSEANFFGPIITGLANKGHEVTSVTSKLSNLPSNVTQIKPLDYSVLYEDLHNPFRMVENSADLYLLFFDMDLYADLCGKVYEDKEFQEKVLNKKFDLILSSALISQCFYGLVPKNNASFILASSFPPPNYLIHGLGTYLPASSVPYSSLPYTDQMNFKDRVHNFLVDITMQIVSELSYIDKMESVYRKHLPGGQGYPGIREIRQNISLFLSNSFFAMNFPRPLLPDIVEVGGLHCRPANPLPVDLEKFISEAPEGFIYFSMGSLAQGKNLPIEIRNMFIRVFSKLKQRVLWKYEAKEMPGCPPNVKVSKWFSQIDILGHPKIRFFITHGGLLSSQEALYNGVPLIGLPVFFDQFANMKQGIKNGYALKLDIYNLKEVDLEWAVNQMLTNSTYKNRAMLLSKVFQDQKETPLERALFWIEYVIRHNGAPHLRSAARDLYWFQYHSLDVILCLVITFLILIYILLYFLRNIFLCCFPSFISLLKLVDRKRKVN